MEDTVEYSAAVHPETPVIPGCWSVYDELLLGRASSAS
jgi:hypothetical protein